MLLPSALFRRASRIVAIIITTLVLVGAGASPALAGSYHYVACELPNGAPVPSGDWATEYGVIGPGVDYCTQQGYAYFELGPAQTGTTSWTGLGITMPNGSGLRATAIAANRWVRTNAGDSDDYAATPTYQVRYGVDHRWFENGTTPLDTCAYAAGCTGFAWPDYSSAPADWSATIPGGATFVGFALACLGDPGGACRTFGGGRAHLRINRLDLTVADDAAPVVAAPSGTVLQPGGRSGIESLTFAASDSGSGVYQGIASVDGVEVARTRASGGAACASVGSVAGTDLVFSRLQPCPASVGLSLSIDTRSLANGHHVLTAVARDAAGNLSNAITQDITVDNVPPTVPATVVPNGTGGQPGTARLGRPGEKRTLSARYRAVSAITGTLRDTANVPIAGASIDVDQRIATASGAWVRVATVVTDAKGVYRYVPTTGSSRSVRFSYAPVVGSISYTAARTVAVKVRAGMTISAPKAVSPRGLIAIRGRVKLDGIPKHGTRVEVQAIVNGAWRTVANRPIAANGTWTYRHRLTTARNTTLSFRARVLASGDLPTAESTSSAVRTRVR
ncbi:MAG: hypothetical protein AAGC46_18340 [Solirubrobacteraceae bacterium]|nr:hypothetical protein [Patulibacter sp.]